MTENNSLKEVWEKEYIIDKVKKTGWTMYEYHFHDHFEVLLSLTDDISVYINGKLYQINKGSLILFNHMDLHRVVVPDEIIYERYAFHFKPGWVDDFLLSDVDIMAYFLNRPPEFCPVIQLNEQQLEKILPFFEKSIAIYQNEPFGSNLYNKILLVELLLNIAPLYHARTDVPVADSKDYLRIQPVLKYIHENIEKSLSISIIASEFYLSNSHLEHLFKKVTGSSITKYIIYKRILKARELLKTGQSVSCVSEAVGFNNISHFIRTFKKIVGSAPTKYLKKQF